jgi:hypothetical protein
VRDGDYGDEGHDDEDVVLLWMLPVMLIAAWFAQVVMQHTSFSKMQQVLVSVDALVIVVVTCVGR